jgi:hypothetical protein
LKIYLVAEFKNDVNLGLIVFPVTSGKNEDPVTTELFTEVGYFRGSYWSYIWFSSGGLLLSA